LLKWPDLTTDAIGHCRDRRVNRLLVVKMDLVGVSIPTLVDRFLMVEEWARESSSMVVVAMGRKSRIHSSPKCGVRVAADLGLVADVFTSESDALKWLSNYDPPD
jgi:hypothetical protein